MTDKKITSNDVLEFSKKNDVRQYEQYIPEWHIMSDIVSGTQPWFWPGMIPGQTLTLFAGIGGIGKSLLLLYIAAKTTTGEKFTAGGIDFMLPHGSVILLSAEDECQYQIRPKLLAMNANPAKVYYLKSKVGEISRKPRFVELDKDIRMLEQQIQAAGDVRLIVIDPVSYFIGNIRDHINNEVANFLNELIEMARKYDVAVILNKHLRKHAAGSKGVISATSEVGGAGAWTNTPRKCWLLTTHPEDENIRVITQMKDNLSKKDSDSLAFRIMEGTIEDNGLIMNTTYLSWLDEKITITADEAVDKNTYQKGKLESAIDFIYDYLIENGQSLLKNIESAALRNGVKPKTFRKAYLQFEQNFRNSLTISKGIRGGKVYMLKD